MADKIPVEIWIKILTHADLVGPDAPRPIRYEPFQRETIGLYNRRSSYVICSLISKYFYDIMRTPFVQAEWIRAYHKNHCRDSVAMAVRNGWLDALKFLCQSDRWPIPDIRTSDRYMKSVMNDTLIFTACQILPRVEVAQTPPPKELEQDPLTPILVTYFQEDVSGNPANMETRSDSEQQLCRVPEDDDDFWFDDILQAYYTTYPVRDTESIETRPTRLTTLDLKRRRTRPMRRRFSIDGEEPEETPVPLSQVLDTIKILIDHGAEVAVLDNFALRRAAGYGSVEVMKLLLDYGASPHHAKNETIRNVIKNGSIEGMHLLLEHGASVLACILESCRIGDLTMLQNILQSSKSSKLEEARKWCVDGYIDIVPFEIQGRGENWLRDCWKQHPLVETSRLGFDDMLLTLMAWMNTDLSKDEVALVVDTAFQWACRSDQLSVVCTLARYSVVDLPHAVEVAARFSNAAVLRYLLENHRSELQLDEATKQHDFWRHNPGHPILMALRTTSDPEISELLMKKCGIEWKHITELFMMGNREHILRSSSPNHIVDSSDFMVMSRDGRTGGSLRRVSTYSNFDYEFDAPAQILVTLD